MIDPWFGALIAVALLLVFVLGLTVPRKTRVVRTATSGVTLKEISLRLITLEEAQKKNDHDVRNIRMAMESVPTKDAMNKVLVEVGTLKGEVKGMHDTLSTNGYSLRRIEEFLINAAVSNIAAASKGPEAPK